MRTKNISFCLVFECFQYQMTDPSLYLQVSFKIMFEKFTHKNFEKFISEEIICEKINIIHIFGRSSFISDFWKVVAEGFLLCIVCKKNDNIFFYYSQK